MTQATDTGIERQEDGEALLRLVLCGGALAPRRRLIEACGNAREALRAGAPTWRAHGLDDAQCRGLQQPERDAMQRGRAWLSAPECSLVGCHDADYPPLLRRIAAPPLALFVAGDPARLWHPAIAVVGSRTASAGGRDNAAAFARAFVEAGFCVASGMAAGIDTAAHAGALAAGGLTVAVLGTGIDVPYPRSNAALYARIAATGAVVSELPPGTTARPEQFPSRNRILVGLALGTVVIEAALRSGALISARLAADAGREVFALPGSIHNPMARGCHRLIRDGAALVETPDEVMAALAPAAAGLAGMLDGIPTTSGTVAPVVPDVSGEGVSPAGPDHQRLWRALGHDPTPMEDLVRRTGLTAAELSSILLVMELEGRVVSEHGRYSRTRR